MEWWEIIGLVVAWLVGIYLRGKIYEDKKGINDGRGRNRDAVASFFCFIQN